MPEYKSLLDRFRAKSDEELLDRVLKQDDFTPEARKTLWRVLRERGLAGEADRSLALVRELTEAEKERGERQESDLARRIRRVNRRNELSFDLEDPQRLAFERALHDNEIEFYTEDTGFDIAFDLRHRRKYFFADEDFAIANQLLNELSVEDSPTQVGRRRFVYFYLGLVIVVAIVFLLWHNFFNH